MAITPSIIHLPFFHYQVGIFFALMGAYFLFDMIVNTIKPLPATIRWNSTLSTGAGIAGVSIWALYRCYSRTGDDQLTLNMNAHPLAVGIGSIAIVFLAGPVLYYFNRKRELKRWIDEQDQGQDAALLD